MAGFWIKIWGEHTAGFWIGGSVTVGNGMAPEAAPGNIFDGLTFATPSDAAAFAGLPDAERVDLRHRLAVHRRGASSFDSTGQRWIENAAGVYERRPPYSAMTRDLAFRTPYDREAFENLSSDAERLRITAVMGLDESVTDENGAEWRFRPLPDGFSRLNRTPSQTLALMEFETEADAAEARLLSEEELQALRFELVKNGQALPSRDARGREWIERPSGRYALAAPADD